MSRVSLLALVAAAAALARASALSCSIYTVDSMLGMDTSMGTQGSGVTATTTVCPSSATKCLAYTYSIEGQDLSTGACGTSCSHTKSVLYNSLIQSGWTCSECSTDNCNSRGDSAAAGSGTSGGDDDDYLNNGEGFADVISSCSQTLADAIDDNSTAAASQLSGRRLEEAKRQAQAYEGAQQMWLRCIWLQLTTAWKIGAPALLLC